jgi:hypothetical protein
VRAINARSSLHVVIRQKCKTRQEAVERVFAAIEGIKGMRAGQCLDFEASHVWPCHAGSVPGAMRSNTLSSLSRRSSRSGRRGIERRHQRSPGLGVRPEMSPVRHRLFGARQGTFVHAVAHRALQARCSAVQLRLAAGVSRKSSFSERVVGVGMGGAQQKNIAERLMQHVAAAEPAGRELECCCR